MASAPFARKLATQLITLVVVTLLGLLAAADLVLLTPGYGASETDLDARLSSETMAALRAARAQKMSLPAFYLSYVRAAVHGDLGTSESFGQPVVSLLYERTPETLALVGGGAFAGWLLALGLAALSVRFPHPSVTAGSAVLAGALLAVPPAVLALLFFWIRAPLTLAMALILLPRLFGTFRTLLFDLARSPLLIAAKARGVGPAVLALKYFAAPAAGRLAALFGIATVIAFGCSVPMEALCGVPGLGQLAWKAAMARDLPLLSALSLIVTVLVTAVHSAGELLSPEAE